MNKSNRVIPAAQFKAECLRLINTVHDQQISYIITKRGKPFARLVPISSEEPADYFGCMLNTASTSDDIISSLDLEWDAKK